MTVNSSALVYSKDGYDSDVQSENEDDRDVFNQN